MSMATETLLRWSVVGEIEHIDGEWRANHRGLGLFAYGASPDEAGRRLVEAIHLLADTLSEDGLERLTARLDKAGIEYSQLPISDAPRRFSFTHSEVRTLEAGTEERVLEPA